MTWLPYAVAAWLFAAGLYGLASSRNLIHLVGCLSVCQSATYVLLLGLGYRWGSIAPIFYDHPPGTPAVDPVMQALVLTDIVVGATLTALLLVLTVQIFKRSGTLDPEHLKPMPRRGDAAGDNAPKNNAPKNDTSKNDTSKDDASKNAEQPAR